MGTSIPGKEESSSKGGKVEECGRMHGQPKANECYLSEKLKQTIVKYEAADIRS